MGASRSGVHTVAKFDDQGATVIQSFDAAPHLKHAEQARAQTAGMGWGEGRLVGHIPAVFYEQIMTIRDPAERDAAIMKFFRENTAFVMFDKFKRDL